MSQAAPTRIKRCRPLLGTFVEITLEAERDEAALHKIADKAFGMIASVQKLMSFHHKDSDVSRLNRCAHISPLRVHSWTHQVLAQAVELSAQTEGAFDISIAPKLVKWDYLPKTQNLPEAIASWQDITLNPDCTVSFDRPLMIDLGGIAKGFAVDKAIDYLSTKGITRAVVNAGGDMRVLGAGPHTIGVRHPGAPQEAVVPAVMPRSAVATSAGYFANRKVHGQRVSPIVHPRTGKPLRSTRSVSIFSSTCMMADALTKAVLLAPQDVWTKVLAAQDSLALFVSSRGDETHFPSLGMSHA